MKRCRRFKKIVVETHFNNNISGGECATKIYILPTKNYSKHGGISLVQPQSINLNWRALPIEYFVILIA